MTIASVNWVGGVWFLEHQGHAQAIVDQPWLDSWLAARDASSADLDFPSAALRQRFVHDFGAPPANPRAST
jgi:hypothetical protein